jgi:dipeptidyl aminopeptidase/acylaminoacyl peptidase
MRRILLLLAVTTAAIAPLAADRAVAPEPRAAASAFPLTIDSIMRGPDLLGAAPSEIRWSWNATKVYFEWQKPGDRETVTYVIGREGGTPRRLTSEEAKLVPPVGGTWDEPRRRVLFADRGDIIILDAVSDTRTAITQTVDRESNPRWARNGTHVTFVRDRNLFIVPVQAGDSALVRQLVNVTTIPPEPHVTDSQRYLREEEVKLIEYTSDQVDERAKAEAELEAERLPTLELADGQSVADLQLSPDGTHVYVLVEERGRGARTAEVPAYVTESAYMETISTRTLVGDARDTRRLAIVDLETKRTVWADGGFAGDGPAGEKAGMNVPRQIDWAMPAFSSDGRRVVGYARARDNKDRWLVLMDSETGRSRVLDGLHDDAWIRDLPIDDDGNVAGFLPDDRRIWFVSEQDGWAHLYTLDVTAPDPRATQITSGAWEITSASLTPDRQRFLFVSTKEDPGERHVYSISIDGGEPTKLSSVTGAHDPTISPDGTMYADVHSYSNKPPELYLVATQPGATMVQITTTPTEEWRSFDWIDPKVLTFAARDGAAVRARLYTPEMIGATRDPMRPGVVFVHGAGYAQNAHKYWSTYYREYMFHNLLASRGYVVLDVDYRASSGYGRDWRTAVYRHMGGKDLDDIVDGAKFLVTAERVEPTRIGVYGGSYGGFITLMALFTSPDTFAAGAALRPVADWAHYNHGYTSSILNQPQDDPDAYRRSSPIYFAEGLKGALLICHGMVDTNVHFQDSVRLAQRLIELRKENWELAMFPVENHRFREETSWADEFKRILKLFEENLRSRR